MLPLALLLLAPSWADTGCGDPEIYQTRPADSQSEVPLDARIVALVSTDCGGSSTWEVVLTHTVDGEKEQEVERQEIVVDHSDPFLILEPAQSFEPETDHTVYFSSSRGESTSIAFETGTDLTAGLAGQAPTVEALYAHVYPDEEDPGAYHGHFHVVAVVTPAPDPDSLSMLELRSTDGETLERALAPSSGSWDVKTSISEEERPEEACLTAVQVDGTGLESDAAVNSCVDLADRYQPLGDVGCATGRGSSGLGYLALVFAMLLGATRRAQHPAPSRAARCKGWMALLLLTLVSCGVTTGIACLETDRSRGEYSACEPDDPVDLPIDLELVLAAGSTDDGTLYVVAIEDPDVELWETEYELYVASDDLLQRRTTSARSGNGSPDGPTLLFLQFDEGGSDHTLAIQRLSDGVLAMALGEGALSEWEGEVSAVAAAGEWLEVQEDDAVDGTLVAGSGGTPRLEYFGELETGDKVVLLRPPGGELEDSRLFLGPEGALLQYPVLEVASGDEHSGEWAYIAFESAAPDTALYYVTYHEDPGYGVLVTPCGEIAVEHVYADLEDLEDLDFDCL
jgi:hypothetical protein